MTTWHIAGLAAFVALAVAIPFWRRALERNRARVLQIEAEVTDGK